ncbi:MAG: type III-A CRISPR-associated RAMP protein Csm5 [Desulfobacteraceae bacterium 4572_88]|nr:MAG: type III-A CRISPR-associated RAMP protein Csm5 [Desulfobacteraceae bacterium 4572_88]
MKEHRGHETYRFTILTPVHVGTGEKLGRTDIAQKGNQLTVVDMESVFSRFQGDLSAFDDLFEDRQPDLSKFLRDHKIPLNQVRKYSLSKPAGSGFVSNINEMIKTGMGNPILPGSSVKGAIRTVFLWHLVQSDDRVRSELENIRLGAKAERADDELDKLLFGKNPNHDFMRGLQVGDVEFSLSDIQAVESKVMNLVGNNQLGWKRMGRNGGNLPDPRGATAIHCEALRPIAKSEGKMKVDEFLIDEAAAGLLGFSDEQRELLTHVPEKCNAFARQFIADEISFFESCKMQSMLQFYEKLQQQIPKDDSAFLLHLGWGSGWRSMTGNYLEKDVLGKLRQRFGLGNAHSEIFPKTRKIAFENGNPAYPLGWVKVEKKTGASSESGSPKPKKSEFMESFDGFRIRPSPENFVAFAGKIRPEDADELKSVSLKEIQSISIGYAKPFLACDLPGEIRNILAEKLLTVIRPNKKWNAKKQENYELLRTAAEISPRDKSQG